MALNNFKNKYSLTEIGQHVPNHFALINVGKDVDMITPAFKCRDFFNEVVAYTHHKARADIYGFSSLWAKDWKKKHIISFAPDKVTYAMFKENLEQINEFLNNHGLLSLTLDEEARAKLEGISKFHVRGGLFRSYEDMAVVGFTKEHMRNSVFTSIYTAAIRMAYYKTFGNYSGAEGMIYKIMNSSMWPLVFDFCCENDKDNPFLSGTYISDKSDTIHGSSGLASLEYMTYGFLNKKEAKQLLSSYANRMWDSSSLNLLKKHLMERVKEVANGE